jgi:hypothetical protein
LQANLHSWTYRYYQEGQRPEHRDRYFTNKALMANLADGIPVGVLRQVTPKPGPQYEVLGLARVVDWRDGYFTLVGETTSAEANAAPGVDANPLGTDSTANALPIEGPTRGPIPSSWLGIMVRNAEATATTYVLRFGRRDIWKIGHAQDVQSRLAEVNKHIPHEVLGERWAVVSHQAWASQTEAYEMEQRALKLLEARRTHGERVICTEAELHAAWTKAAETTSSD